MRRNPAFAKPPKPVSRMMPLPDRQAVAGAFDNGVRRQATAAGDAILARLSAIELSLEETAAGMQKCLTVTFWAPDGKNKTLERMLPVDGVGHEEFLAAAELHGKNAQRLCSALAYKMAGLA